MQSRQSTQAGIRRKRLVRIAGTTLFCLLWLVALAATGAVGLEVLLRVRSRWRVAAEGFPKPRFQRLDRAYGPFAVQHLHPQYLFFFPLDPRERVALTNDTCSMDADGFRGPGPADAGGRRLAFLLGGSTAFGFFASSDRTTITGYLNRLQDEYFFVNAGVPGWTTTQEMFRLAFQIVDYHPALVVTLDGANDAVLIDSYSRAPFNYPAGTPGSFDGIATLVNQPRASPAKRVIVSLMELLLPELQQRIEEGPDRVASGPPPESALRAGAARYWSNLARMNELAEAQGARFITVFQPVAQLHRHLPQGAPFEDIDGIDRFHRAAMAQNPYQFEFHDLATFFDQSYATIPVVHPDITDETVFVDQVHLYDPGNEAIARYLATLIR